MRERGFTLIEILVAITMIGILSTVGIAMINPLEQIKKTRDVQRKNDLLQIRNALDAYNSDNNVYPSSANNKIKDESRNPPQVINWGSEWRPYIEKLPKDPLSPQQDYYYKVSEDKTSYTVYARLERSNDPQIIPESESSPYNFAISSTNIAVAIFLTPTPTPTSTPTPTNTPTPTPTLVPGRDYKRVFVTSTQYSGNLGGLSGADDKCQLQANTSLLTQGGRFLAWLSDSLTSAASRLTHTTVPYQLLDGTRIADNWNDLITEKQPDNTYLRNSINKDENNNLVDDETWTATWEDGSAALFSTTCSNWESASNTIYASAGYSNARNIWWTRIQSRECVIHLRLYCFEQ